MSTSVVADASVPGVTRHDALERRRDVRRERTRRRGWTISLLGVAVVCGATWWITRSPIFTMRELRVSGTTHLTQSQVARIAGLSTGANVLWLSPSRVERLLEHDPWIASATVERSLPGTVTISIRERHAVAVAMPGSWLISADGVVLGRAREGDLVPEIHPGVVLRSGVRLSTARPQLLVARSLSGSLAARVRSVTTRKGRGVDLILRAGGVVDLGPAVDLRAKELALAGVLRWAARRGVGVGTIDVRAPAAPALLPAQP